MSANSLVPDLINPGIIFTLGAFIALIVPAIFRRAFLLAVVGVSAFVTYTMPLGMVGGIIPIFGAEMQMTRFDSLARLFVIVFHIAAALNVIYGFHNKDRMECFATLAYPGAAMGGVLAGDWLTLFVWWEMAAITSVLLVLAPRTRETYLASMRYLAIQIASGVLLLGGIVALFRETGSLEFNRLSLRDETGEMSFAPLMIFIAFGIKSAFPLLHNWVQDAYPKSTIGGTIMLSVFTTKLAVYAIARAFPGTEELIYIGAVMTIFPIFFALVENDLRKVLCYSINNQVGFMLVAIGVGAINGAVGYAFTNIIFESLLFMAVGAVMYRTGTSLATELGGLYKSMKWTFLFALVGAFSISAFPGFAGFVTKGLILDGVAEAHYFWIWCILLFASAGVLEHAGIKIPYFTFLAHDSGKRPKEAPPQMLLAMAISSVLCIGIGLYPEPLFNLLPDQEQIKTYHPYTAYHIVEQLQLLLWAVLAFALLIKFKLYPAEVRSTNLDTDWFYRIPGKHLLFGMTGAIASLWKGVWQAVLKLASGLISRLYATHGPEGALARSFPIGFMALMTAVLLAITLLMTLLITWG